MSKYFGRLTAHPSITGWKTAPRASGADDAASVLFPDSGGIMLSGVAELSVFSIQIEIRPKKERRHEVAGSIVLRSFGEKTHPNVLTHYSDVWCSDPSFGCSTASLP
jgi:hypothetical protein